ncbi:Aste57867_3411 [Aphanomyces stellatus]|uniref:Aste57867_3411 protein n=1 Tax=Aphanomyces stellatus TaxID=120398 RepID=A0A485K9L2_9STRA|nr:hypothetical protein As57867_003401 [Aphanomyces stellatus]VFT80577.1 Aste57867_3411 [Aphanomyces stellatus]
MEPTSDSWNLADGLQYFLASCSSEEDDGGVHTTVDGNLSATASTASSERPRVRLSTHRRQQHEIDSLKTELARQIAVIRDTKFTSSPLVRMTYYERMAKFARLEKLRAQLDNDELLLAVHEHAAFIDEMKGVLHKKRRLICPAEPPTNEWEFYRLPHADDGNDPTRRHRAMHAILDRERHRMHSVFLRHGLLCTPDDVFRTELSPQPATAEIHFVAIEHVALAAPFRTVGAAIWRAMSSLLEAVDGIEQSIDSIDDKTVYYCMTDARHATPCHANILVKHYPLGTRDVIIARSVLDDPMRPARHNDLVEDVTALCVVLVIVVASLPGQYKCHLTMVVRINLGDCDGPSNAAAMEDVITRLEAVSVAQRPLDHTLPPDALRKHLAAPTPLGNLHIYLARSLRVEAPFKEAINNAIDAYWKDQVSSTRQHATADGSSIVTAVENNV